MYFFDSYAIIEILRKNENYAKFRSYTIFTTTLNLAEVYFALIRETGQKTADNFIENFNFEFINISPEIAIESARFKTKNAKLKVSYADCIGYNCALKNNLIFLTGDKAFENMPNVEFVK